MGRPSLLYVTDLAYPARGRRYGDEDVALSARLRAEFDLALCHPLDAVALMDRFDGVVVRNSGPVLHYRAAYDGFRARASAHGTRVYNPLTGRGDMAGKRYLVDLTRQGYPVIPTVDRPEDLDRLPASDLLVAKPEDGADSHGLRTLSAGELDALDWEGVLVQPHIAFVHEISFVFVDAAFQYALHAPDPDRRWDLRPYPASEEDLAFARRFVEWNTLAHGIQRVDACRTEDGALLLVELEDLNPYLSLDRVPAGTREAFVAAMAASLRRWLAGPTG